MGAVRAFAFDHSAGGDRDGLAGHDPAGDLGQGNFDGRRNRAADLLAELELPTVRLPKPTFGMPARSLATWRWVLSTHHGNAVS